MRRRPQRSHLTLHNDWPATLQHLTFSAVFHFPTPPTGRSKRVCWVCWACAFRGPPKRRLSSPTIGSHPPKRHPAPPSAWAKGSMGASTPQLQRDYLCRGLGCCFFAGARPQVSAAKTTPRSTLSGGAIVPLSVVRVQPSGPGTYGLQHQTIQYIVEPLAAQ